MLAFGQGKGQVDPSPDLLGGDLLVGDVPVGSERLGGALPGTGSKTGEVLLLGCEYTDEANHAGPGHHVRSVRGIRRLRVTRLSGDQRQRMGKRRPYRVKALGDGGGTPRK